MSKFGKNTNDYYKHQSDGRVFQMGVVESSEDSSDAGRIQVRIKGVDDHIGNTEALPYAFPLIQKFFHVIPQVGETVWIFTPDTKQLQSNRLYIGPIISQPQNLERDPHVVSSTAGLSGGFAELQTAPSTIPTSRGVYPRNNEISIQGRNNADITFKDSEIVIRAGKFIAEDKTDNIPRFNDKNPTYIQLNHNVESDGKKVGILNMVADRIHLLSHEGSPNLSLADQDSTISEEELIKLLSDAHPLVFGDLLIEYLESFKDAFLNHVHAYNGMLPQDLGGQAKIKKFLEFDVSKIISKNIKIN
jgi:hypothetical protein